jgi:Mg2+/Co2+ transporter CorB
MPPAAKPATIGFMNFQKILIAIAAVALTAAAFRQYGWAGVAVAVGAMVMWLLLHLTRTMQVLRKAANRPIGFVSSAVMLNARLQSGVTLLHVIGLTRSLGQQLSPANQQPEIFRWTDEGQSHVTGTFASGKLSTWVLVRPEPPAQT